MNQYLWSSDNELRFREEKIETIPIFEGKVNCKLCPHTNCTDIGDGRRRVIRHRNVLVLTITTISEVKPDISNCPSRI